jgi:deoxyribonuclease IV
MIRVRAALSDGDVCRKLRGKIPKQAFIAPDCISGKYPCTLLKALPKDETYKYLGIITEELLQKSSIDNDMLCQVAKRHTNIDLSHNVIKAKTTERYLNSVRTTACQISDLIGSSSTVAYNSAISISDCNVVGHPDIIAGNHIFEVKTTGQLKKNWRDFILQTFCYAALYSAATTIHIVLPLQEYIWTWDIKNNWPKRAQFVQVLKEVHPPFTQESKEQELENAMFGPMVFSTFPIGAHVNKRKTMKETIERLPTYQRPYQVFLTKSTKMNIPAEDVQQTSELIKKTGAKMFIHSPYLLNLCLEPEEGDNYVVSCLRQHLETAVKMGARGVVVHVGKSCGKEHEKALNNMKHNIERCLDAASAECPLLLETPAGQGTETLTTIDDFMNFVVSIPHNNFGVCIDTCHTFASGIQPLDYMKKIICNKEWKPYLKLVHFNDSKGACGSCIDRHAYLGRGLVSKEQLYECALLASVNEIPMLTE